MKHVFWLLLLISFTTVAQHRTNPEKTTHILVDSLKNQILYITNESITRLDATSLEVVRKQKILGSNYKLSLRPIMKQDRLVFLDQKGGSVFGMSDKDSLVRLDNSNIENFLIGSAVFIKNDTLFRHGGYGYWSQSDFFTYLDKSTTEWEIYNISQTSEKPISIHDHFAIDIGGDFYFFGGQFVPHYGSRKMVSNNEVWSFNFQSKNWKLLGKLNLDSFDVKANSFIAGRFVYAIKELSVLSQIDVLQNRITDYKTSPILYLIENDVDPVFFKGNLYYLNTKGVVKKATLKAITDKVSKTTSLYTKERTPLYLLIIFAGIFLCLTFFVIHRYLKSRNSFEILENGLKFKSKFVELDSLALSILKMSFKKEIEFTEIYDLVSKQHLSKIQNERVRNQYLDKINMQIKWLTGSKSDILIVVKSSFDARYKSVIFNRKDYDYFI